MNKYAFGTKDDRKHNNSIVDGSISFLHLASDLNTIFSDCYDDFIKVQHWIEKYSHEYDWELKLKAKANMAFMQASEMRY